MSFVPELNHKSVLRHRYASASLQAHADSSLKNAALTQHTSKKFKGLPQLIRSRCKLEVSLQILAETRIIFSLNIHSKNETNEFIAGLLLLCRWYWHLKRRQNSSPILIHELSIHCQPARLTYKQA